MTSRSPKLPDSNRDYGSRRSSGSPRDHNEDAVFEQDLAEASRHQTEMAAFKSDIAKKSFAGIKRIGRQAYATLESVPIVGLAMAYSLGLFGIIFVLTVAVCSLPGYFVHQIIWRLLNPEMKSEAFRMFHDLSLLFLTVAGFLAFGYLFAGPTTIDDNIFFCPHRAYCD